MAETTPPATPAPRRAPRAVLALLVVVLLAIVGAVSSGWWAVRSERGTAWLLSLVPGMRVEAPEGRLLGDFTARRISVDLPRGGGTVTLDGVAWRGFDVARAASPRWARVTLASLSIARIDVVTRPTPAGAPMQAPTDLRLPFEFDLQALRVGEIHAAALGAQPIRDLAAHVHLGAADGAEHRVDGLAFAWDRLQARADARIATTGSLSLQAGIGLAQAGAPDLPPWNASVALAGPLASPRAQATLRADPVGGQPAPSLDADATVHPFATWPVGDLQARARALDLAAFSSVAPHTALDLDASATSTAADQPASVALTLSNAQPGRWDEHRLPLHHLGVDLAARPDRASELELRSVAVDLGTPTVSAGRITGTGRWSPAGWQFTAALADVRPALLDVRAPAMRLSGPLEVQGASAIDVVTTLSGDLVERGTHRAVQLKADARLQPQRIEVKELSAVAAGARARVSGLFTQDAADAPWRALATLGLVDFDPATWWPGASTASLRAAPTRLNAQGSVDLAVPLAAFSRPALELVAALRGQATLRFAPSTLVGVPLTGNAEWRNTAGAQASASFQFDAAGNSVHGDGHLALSGKGSDDWNVTIDAAALDRLSAVYQLVAGPGSEATLAGSLQGQAHLSGRWPTLATQGQFEAHALRLGTLDLQQAEGRWTLGTQLDAPLGAHVTVTQAALRQGTQPGPSLETLTLDLQGTGRAHTLALRAVSKARPPSWTEAMQPGPAPTPNARTVAVLQAQGGLFGNGAAATQASGWRGTLQQLDLRSSSPGAAPLLHSQDVAIETLWTGGAPRASVQPGRADLLGGAIRWSRIAWQAATATSAAQLDADAEFDPLRIAPLLARVQPDFGWSGDLAIAGHVKVRSAPAFSADIVIERRSGDLSVTDELGSRALGLTDLRLGLAVDNGTWSFTQGMAGKTLGVLAGAEVVRTSPQAVWPPADAPLQGVLELRVDDLGTWGSWVPPGWRLGGALHTSASFGGRFGAPEYTGLVEGTQLSVRNFLQGVNVTDGDVAVRLQGSTARIERFTAKAGTGTLRLDGDAELGAAPRTTLHVAAEKFQLLGRVDRRIVASGDGTLRIDARTLAFDGRFGVDEGLIDFTRSDAPTLSDDVTVHRAKDAPSPAAAASAAATPEASPLPTATPTRQVALDLNVDLGRELAVRGRGLDAKLRGQLHLTSPGGKLAVDGTVRAEDGTYAAYGQKLVIDRGLITFSGAVENPRLDIEATRPDIDTRVGVIISGTPASPRVRLFSEPDMSDIDKLSWLVMGHASDSNGRTDTALLQRAALALFAGEGGGPTDQITKALGLDDIALRQQTDGDVTQTVLALGKQLSKRWYVGYERGLNATTGSFELIYRIAQRFTLRMQSGEDNSVDLIWTWRWR